MYRIYISTSNPEKTASLAQLLDGSFLAVPCRNPEEALQSNIEEEPDLVLFELSPASRASVKDLISKCAELKYPVILLVLDSDLPHYDVELGSHDFIIYPCRPQELIARINQTLRKARAPDQGQVLREGDLVIDPQRYEVSLAGRKILLTFKEYQLLKLLATNPGMVFSREVLLDRIWGYDYYGGTRTVDVHVRRLRSKIEDSTHSFIETVWNVGYRFRPA